MNISQQEQALTVPLSTHELIIINNALNEVCHSLDIEEFSTRMGATLEETKGLLLRINSLLENQENHHILEQ